MDVEDPPVEVEDPPVEVDEPPVEVEDPPVDVEDPPVEVEEPPVELDDPPVDDPPVDVDEPPVEVDPPEEVDEMTTLPLEPAREGLQEASATEEGGSRLLELLGRLPTPPPTVVIKRERTQREHARTLSSALEAGAFAVLERPVHIETALEVLRRILSKFYKGRWPGCC